MKTKLTVIKEALRHAVVKATTEYAVETYVGAIVLVDEMLSDIEKQTCVNEKYLSQKLTGYGDY